MPAATKSAHISCARPTFILMPGSAARREAASMNWTVRYWQRRTSNATPTGIQRRQAPSLRASSAAMAPSSTTSRPHARNAWPVGMRTPTKMNAPGAKQEDGTQQGLPMIPTIIPRAQPVQPAIGVRGLGMVCTTPPVVTSATEERIARWDRTRALPAQTAGLITTGMLPHRV